MLHVAIRCIVYITLSTLSLEGPQSLSHILQLCTIAFISFQRLQPEPPLYFRSNYIFSNQLQPNFYHF